MARCSGTQGHIIGIGGVCGEVVSTNDRMPEPTVIEYLGRLADHDGHPLHSSRFYLGASASPKFDDALARVMMGRTTFVIAHRISTVKQESTTNWSWRRGPTAGFSRNS